MAGAAGGRGSSYGIDRAVLEAGVGSTGAVLEARAPEAGGGRPDARHAASVPDQIQPRAALPNALEDSAMRESITRKREGGFDPAIGAPQTRADDEKRSSAPLVPLPR